MKTLHFFSLNSCFVSTHVSVRLTHDYRDYFADNDYAILFKSQVYSTPENVFLSLHVLRNRWFTNSFKTDEETFAAEY